jgi:hypothetical protein
METIARPAVRVTFQVEIELEFDSFKGKTPQQFAENVEDDMMDALSEMRPEILGVFSTMTDVTPINCD